MRTRLTPLLLIALGALLLAGCHAKPEPQEAERLELFHEGKGVRFNEDIKQLLGVELVEVTEKPLAREFKKSAQVFEAVNGSARATFLVDASETNDIAAGKSAIVTANNLSVTGSVLRVERIADALLGQGEAIVEFADAQNLVTIGTTVEVHITANAKSVLAVPRTALLAAADGNYVYVANGKHLTRTKVKTGASFDGFIGVEDGLYPGDQVAATAVSSIWLVELSALKGGTPCCVKPKK